MGYWIITKTTDGRCVNYSTDATIPYDPLTMQKVQSIDLPVGGFPGQYLWDGTQLVKKPLSALQTVLDTVILSPLPPTLDQIKAIFTTWRAQV